MQLPELCIRRPVFATVMSLMIVLVGVISFQRLTVREYPKIDLRSPYLRRALLLVGLLTFVNFAIMGAASYKGVEYMDSAQFCGQTCHTVMSPEFTAYVNSPHSRVACVECHIGPGAPWFVKAKISGVRQVFAVTLKTYSRPIPSPVHELRPARDTCACMAAKRSGANFGRRWWRAVSNRTALPLKQLSKSSRDTFSRWPVSSATTTAPSFTTSTSLRMRRWASTCGS